MKNVLKNIKFISVFIRGFSKNQSFGLAKIGNLGYSSQLKLGPSNGLGAITNSQLLRMRCIMSKFIVLTGLLIFLMASVGLGAYDSSNVLVNTGYGIFTGPVVRDASTDRLHWNQDYPIKVSGTLDTVTVVLRNTTPTVEEAKIAVLRESGGTYTVVGTFTSSQMLTDAGTNGVVTGVYDCSSAGITVAAGDYIGYGAKFSAGTVGIESLDDAGVTVYRHDGSGLLSDIVKDATFTSVLSSTTGILAIQAQVTTNEKIITDDSTGWTGANVVNINTYDVKPYYIVLKGVQCPDTETLEIKLNYTHATTGVDTAEEIYTIDYSGGAGDGTVSDSYATSSSIAGQESSGIDYFIYIDPASGKQDLYYCNYTDGQGDQGDKDIKHISLNSRGTANITAANKIRRIEFVNAGGNASVEKIIVCRKPIVVMGDSFTSTYGTETILANIGAKLDDSGVFTEQRYVINGGITGNSITYTSSGNCTALRKRWNDFANNQDLCSYRDVIYCFVNGPSINDLASFISSSDSDAHVKARANQVAGSILKMVGDCKFDTIETVGTSPNVDVIMTTMIPSNYNTNGAEAKIDLCIDEINKILRVGAYSMNVPLADLANYPEGYAGENNVHPDSSGVNWIASKIAEAYEKNFVPGNPFDGSDFFGQGLY